MRNHRNTTNSILAAMLIMRIKGTMPTRLPFSGKEPIQPEPCNLVAATPTSNTPLRRQDRPYPGNISHRQILYGIRISDKGGAQREASAITQVGRRIALRYGLPLIGRTWMSQGIPAG